MFAAPPQLYRQFFTPRERKRLEGSASESAASEIALLRIALSRLLAVADPARRRRPRPKGRERARLSLASLLAILTAICAAAFTLASLARFEHKFNGDTTDPVLAALDSLDPDDL